MLEVLTGLLLGIGLFGLALFLIGMMVIWIEAHTKKP